jgi:hypothetical protein
MTVHNARLYSSSACKTMAGLKEVPSDKLCRSMVELVRGHFFEPAIVLHNDTYLGTRAYNESRVVYELFCIDTRSMILVDDWCRETFFHVSGRA